jgi:hypothetical protein
VFLEEPLDALRRDVHMVLLLEAAGQLLQAQRGVLDIFHQEPEGRLRVQGGHGAGRQRQGCSLALLAIELRVSGQVKKVACQPDPVQSASLVQAGQDGVTRVLEFFGQLAGGQSGGTACQEVINGGGQAAVFGEADPAEVPQPLAVKVGAVAEGVPLAVMGVAAAIADLLEEAPHGDAGAIQGLSQLVEHPAFAAVEQFSQALGWGQWRSHR